MLVELRVEAEDNVKTCGLLPEQHPSSMAYGDPEVATINISPRN